MTLDERLMFHITDGALRRWSLWNEATFPAWAIGDEQKYELFQDWKKNPFTRTDKKDEEGQPLVMLHPMSDFLSWPYWLVLDIAHKFFSARMDFADLVCEPDNLKEAIVEECDRLYSENEKQSPSQLAT